MIAQERNNMYGKLNLEDHKSEITQKIEYVMEILDEKPKEAKEVLEDVLVYIDNNL